MEFQNNNKNPNELHKFLIENNLFPTYLKHNADYNEDGKKISEATIIWIGVESENEQALLQLVSQFLNS